MRNITGIGTLLALATLLLVVSTLSRPAAAVNKNDFKTCEQSSFCQRQRKLADLLTAHHHTVADDDSSSSSTAAGHAAAQHPYHYHVSPGTLHFDESHGTVSGRLVRGIEDPVHLEFRLTALAGNTVRFQASVVGSGFVRYEAASTVLTGQPRSVSIEHAHVDNNNSNNNSSSSSVFRFHENSQFIVRHNPFVLDFVVAGDRLLSFNDRGLLNIEDGSELVLPDELPNTGDAIIQNNDADVQASPSSLYRRVPQSAEQWRGNSDSRVNGPRSLGLDVTFPGSEHVFGIPQHASEFNLKSTRGENAPYSEPYRLFNLDVFEYIVDSPMALYGSIPFLMSHKGARGSAGIFWVNSAEMWIDVARPTAPFKLTDFLFGSKAEQKSTETHWMAESGALDVFIFLGPTPQDVIASYTSLVGRTALPQSFALAYHQCRWNYNDMRDVAEVDQGFDDNDIPYDVLWLDIEHTDNKKYFTWDAVKFSDPVKMQKELASRGRKMVTIIDPHIKKDDGYHIYSEARGKGLFVKNKDGGDFEGHCWPGTSSWLDYLNPAAREYWAGKFAYSQYQGSTEFLFTWNDMNEPSVFNSPEITMPRDNRHFGGWEHRDIHNLYGMLQHQSTALGHVQRDPAVGHKSKRPFVLSRAFFAGTQQFGAIWTGDNTAEWEHLQIASHMLLSIGLAGLTFSGADIGGFFGNPAPDLLARWYQAAAFTPFFRGHAHIDTKRREPWLFGEPFTSIIRDAIRSRYALLPFWYSQFKLANATGLPVLRPLFFEYPADKQVFSIGDSWLVGQDILVKPVIKKNEESVDVYFPGSEPWYDIVTLQAYKGGSSQNVAAPLSKIPAFYRGGSIVPRRERVRRSSSLMHDDPITLIISLDSHAKAFGSLYLDDGESFDYRQGAYIWKQFVFDTNKLKAEDYVFKAPEEVVAAAAIEASAASSVDVNNASGFAKVVIERIVILGLSAAPRRIMRREDRIDFEFTVVEGTGRLDIKKPNISAASNWKIEFLF